MSVPNCDLTTRSSGPWGNVAPRLAAAEASWPGRSTRSLDVVQGFGIHEANGAILVRELDPSPSSRHVEPDDPRTSRWTIMSLVYTPVSPTECSRSARLVGMPP